MFLVMKKISNWFEIQTQWQNGHILKTIFQIEHRAQGLDGSYFGQKSKNGHLGGNFHFGDGFHIGNGFFWSKAGCVGDDGYLLAIY